MAIAPAILWGPLQVSNAAGAIYTVPANTTAVVIRAVFTNESAANVALKVWIVRSGGARSDATIVIGAAAAGQVITAGPAEPYIANSLANLVLRAGDALHAVCDTAASLNAVGSGWTQ